MYQLIGAAFWLAAGIFIGDGDPIVGSLAMLCGIVWLATVPSLPLRRSRRRPMLVIHLE